ncbi:hypothetical protein Lfu02_17750 [Longispora fulva]|uniref:Uncharacterized protein n=1 Tax=Longispora fulva TaxID=619741 RepID=A0A8J7KJB8_9ACTN|nr:hypothetical protein [Longispora fulva]MBG6140220.1 hypothetical protein [Longispora fulva]GIG57403.1 hypothetical protein Lfu02_17750 [Longispora fulva]
MPTLRTWTAGEVVTAAQLNANVRDTGNFLLAPPLASLKQNTAQPFASASWTAFTFDGLDFDRENGHSITTNNSRYTAKTAGWHLVIGTGYWPSNAAGGRQVGLRINGGNIFAKQVVPTVGAGGFNLALTTSAITYLAVGDYIELLGYHTVGANLNTLIDSEGRSTLQLVRLSN